MLLLFHSFRAQDEPIWTQNKNNNNKITQLPRSKCTDVKIYYALRHCSGCRYTRTHLVILSFSLQTKNPPKAIASTDLINKYDTIWDEKKNMFLNLNAMQHFQSSFFFLFIHKVFVWWISFSSLFYLHACLSGDTIWLTKS